MKNPWPRKPIDRRGLVSAATFALLGLALGVRAFWTFDQSWDSIVYHIPFAAFRAGLSDPRHYGIPLNIQADYAGFPPTLDFLNGLVWKITGNVNAINLLTVFAIVGYAVFLWRQFTIRLGIGIAAMLAIPTIQTMATSCYPDVIANLLFSAAILAGVVFFSGERSSRPPAPLVTCIVCLVGAANAKPHFMVLSGLVAIIPTVFLLWSIAFEPATILPYRSRIIAGILLATLVVGVYWVPARNIWQFGNPIYPMGVEFAGVKLAGNYDASHWSDSPAYLQHTPQFFRWLLSVFEYHGFDQRILAYTLGQGDAPATSMALRMGGFFFPLVAATILCIGALVRGGLNRFDRFMLPVLGAATLLMAFLPGSHHLRYYSFWMVLVVSYALVLCARRRGEGVVGYYYTMLLISLVYVTVITGGIYLLPGRPASAREAVRENRIIESLAAVPEGTKTICLINWGQLPFLFDDVFRGPDLPKNGDRVFLADRPPSRCGDAFILRGPF